jgi:predicted phage tail protein
MDGVGRGFPPGDLRASDADRDRALAELSEAFRVGRITADEFDQRSAQAQRARTGTELTALLVDLPLGGSSVTGATVREPAHHAFSVRAVMGASALCAAFLVARAITDAVSPGVAWAGGTLAPAAIAVLLVGLIIFLHVIRADRS